MVKEIVKEGSTCYVCEACGVVYKDKEWAEKCQTFCEQYNGCNLEIKQHGEPPDEET
jgi:hypothetical protein